MAATVRKPSRPRLNRRSPLTKGLVAAWGFSEGQGTRTRAIPGPAVGGRLTGTIATDQLDLALTSDGYTWNTAQASASSSARPGLGLKNTTNARSLRTYLEPRPEPNFSFGWFCDFNLPATITRNHLHITRNGVAGASLILLTCSTAGLLTVTDSFGSSYTSAAGALTTGFHSVVYTRATRAGALYVDGQLVASGNASSDPATAGNFDLRLGSSLTGGNGWDQTTIYGAAFWDRSLTAEDVRRWAVDPFAVVRPVLAVPLRFLPLESPYFADVTP